MKSALNYLLVSLLATASMGSALASGNHAGGHDQAQQEAAIGVAGDAKKVSRTVKVNMTDAMRFTPSEVTVKQGETIRFVVTNAGKIKHEMVLGSEQELKAHAEAMKKHPEMEHADANMVTVAAGATGEMLWQFTTSGKVNFGCLQPGHYDAGMKGAVKVAASTDKVAAMDGHTAHTH